MKLRFLSCNLFGHKWLYSFSSINGKQNFRICKKCLSLERYDMYPTPAWFRTVEYTKKGAMENLGSIYSKK